MYDYSGKNCVVLGGSLGMGAATVEELVKYGAKVYVLDIEKTNRSDVTYIPVDVRDVDSMNAAFAKLPMIDKFFGYAAVSGLNKTLEEVMVTNFLSYKHILDHLLLDKMNEGGAVAIVTSSMGQCWQHWVEEYEWLLTADREKSIEFFQLNNEAIANPYMYGKRVLNAYTYIKAFEYYRKKQVRVNTVWPGYTDTRLMYEFAWAHGTNNEERLNFINNFCVIPGRPSTAKEVADPAIFVNSDLASYFICDCVEVDGGLSNMNAVLRFVPDEYKNDFIRVMEKMLTAEVAARNLPCASKPLVYPQ